MLAGRILLHSGAGTAALACQHRSVIAAERSEQAGEFLFRLLQPLDDSDRTSQTRISLLQAVYAHIDLTQYRSEASRLDAFEKPTPASRFPTERYSQSLAIGAEAAVRPQDA